MSLPYRWHALGTELSMVPNIGELVALEHQVWRVIDIRERAEVDWSEADAQYMAAVVPVLRSAFRPRVMVVRPITVSDEKTAHSQDRHYTIAGSRRYKFDVYPNEHYPICANCHEPLPCRETMAEQVASKEAAKMNRYDQPGVCPACEEVVTHRQQRYRWHENAVVIGGPPVVFHARAQCRYAAIDYENKWVAEDPANRKARLSCTGGVVNHNDGTYECSQGAECPGPTAHHNRLTVCGCCPGRFGCTPSPNSALRVPS